MNITLNTEQQAALDSLKANHKKHTNLDLTDEEYVNTVMLGLINEEAARLFDGATRRIVELFRPKPFEERLEIMAQLEGGQS